MKITSVATAISLNPRCLRPITTPKLRKHLSIALLNFSCGHFTLIIYALSTYSLLCVCVGLFFMLAVCFIFIIILLPPPLLTYLLFGICCATYYVYPTLACCYIDYRTLIKLKFKKTKLGYKTALVEKEGPKRPVPGGPNFPVRKILRTHPLRFAVSRPQLDPSTHYLHILDIQ